MSPKFNVLFSGLRVAGTYLKESLHHKKILLREKRFGFCCSQAIKSVTLVSMTELPNDVKDSCKSSSFWKAEAGKSARKWYLMCFTSANWEQR